jgi:hypothetical protein
VRLVQVVDPDCGYALASCSDQTWNPLYTSLECDGMPVPVDQMFCRLESAKCFGLPTAMARGRVGVWECIPDVYNELVDNQTSLNDCDCNCGGNVALCACDSAGSVCERRIIRSSVCLWFSLFAERALFASCVQCCPPCLLLAGFDPDCLKEFEDIYCDGLFDEGGSPLPLPRERGVECIFESSTAVCRSIDLEDNAGNETVLDCPQLPQLSPSTLAHGRSWNNPPLEWKCDTTLYYQLDGLVPEDAVCNCECGVSTRSPVCLYLVFMKAMHAHYCDNRSSILTVAMSYRRVMIKRGTPSISQ